MYGISLLLLPFHNNISLAPVLNPGSTNQPLKKKRVADEEPGERKRRSGRRTY